MQERSRDRATGASGVAAFGPSQHRTGLKSPWFWLTVVLLVASDLASKAWAFDFLESHGSPNEVGYLEYRVVDPWLRLARLENSGTVWGLFKDGTSVLIGLRLVMVVVLCVIASRVARRHHWRLFGLGLVLGGALGNLYDNLFQANRSVRDFIDVHVPLPWRDSLYHYPTFNIADSAIVVGAILLFFAFGSDKPQAEAVPTEEATST
ncbi:MAG: signal peptidase II [Planctomycetes bacterium]|nr:signal peptidase II [Planctomycetota bacterium]